MATSSEQFPQQIEMDGLSENQRVFSDGNVPPRYLLVGVEPPEGIDYVIGPLNKEQLAVEVALDDNPLSPEAEAITQTPVPGITHRINLRDGLYIDGEYPGGFSEFVRRVAGALLGNPLDNQQEKN